MSTPKAVPYDFHEEFSVSHSDKEILAKARAWLDKTAYAARLVAEDEAAGWPFARSLSLGVARATQAWHSSVYEHRVQKEKDEAEKQFYNLLQDSVSIIIGTDSPDMASLLGEYADVTAARIVDEWATHDDSPTSFRQVAEVFYGGYALELAATAFIHTGEELQANSKQDEETVFNRHLEELAETLTNSHRFTFIHLESSILSGIADPHTAPLLHLRTDLRLDEMLDWLKEKNSAAPEITTVVRNGHIIDYPSNNPTRVIREAIYKAGINWRKQANGWKLNEENTAVEFEKTVEGGKGFVGISIQLPPPPKPKKRGEGLSKTETTRYYEKAADSVLHAFTFQTHKVYLCLLSAIAQKQDPYREPVTVKIDDIVEALGKSDYRGQHRQRLIKEIHGDIESLRRLDFFASQLNIPVTGKKWKRQNIRGNLFNITQASASNSSAPSDELMAVRVEAGEWAEKFLNTETRWIAQVNAGVLSIATDERNTIDRVDQKLTTEGALDGWREKGSEYGNRYSLMTLLDRIGENPNLHPRPRRKYQQVREAAERTAREAPARGIGRVELKTGTENLHDNEEWVKTTTIAFHSRKALEQKSRALRAGKSTLGQELKRMREEDKVTQTSLANFFKISRTYLSQIENGRRKPSEELAARMWAEIKSSDEERERRSNWS